MLVRFTDSDTDISKKEAEELGYRLISMPYAIDGKEILPYVDFDEFDYKSFYDTLRTGVLPTTSALSVDNYKDYFEPVFAAGDDILYVHFSRAMTATFDSMDKAVADLKEKYPERKFYEIDTKMITVGSYVIVREIGRMALAGASAEELVEWAKTEVDRFAVYFFADDLTFFRHSGRVSGIAGIMGTLLGVRPIIHIGEDGKMVSIGKEKGRARALERLVDVVSELGDNVLDHEFVVAHTDAEDLANELREMLKERLGAEKLPDIVVTNPTAGSHCGPNSVGVAFHAKHR